MVKGFKIGCNKYFITIYHFTHKFNILNQEIIILLILKSLLKSTIKAFKMKKKII